MGDSISLKTIVAAAFLVLGHSLLNRAAFAHLSLAMGVHMTPASLQRIWGQSLLAKYIPGGIWQIIGRAVLMKKYGIRHSQSVAIGLAEQLISFYICILLATSAFIALRVSLWMGAITLTLGLAVMAPGWHLPWIQHRSPAKRALALYILAMPFFLAAYAAIATDVPILELTRQVFTGTAAGMAAFFVPGGLGIRESVAAMLAPSHSASLLTAMVATRLITIVVEAGINLTASLQRANPQSPPAQLSHSLTTPRVITGGAALRGDGYPNARNTIAILTGTSGICVDDRAYWLPESFHLWKLSREPIIPKLIGACHLSAGSMLSLFRAMISYRPGDTLYLPYPSLPSMWLLSWLPNQIRPRIFIDAYITLWDSFYQDRRLGHQAGVASRWLLSAESRALRAADRVLVDTTANVEHLVSLYGVDRAHVHSLPLATLPAGNAPQKSRQQSLQHKTRIFFAGTFVPLQGTTVIAQAINILGNRDDLEFILVGDGQLADEAAPLLEGAKGVTWHRGWHPLSVIEDELAQADICLGIFGGEGKASRVLPFKLYMALAASKAIITQSTYSTPAGVPAIPAWTCAATPEALAQAIAALSDDAATRNLLQAKAGAYFNQHLAASNVARHWQSLLEEQPKND